jgi:hypothetical protein
MIMMSIEKKISKSNTVVSASKPPPQILGSKDKVQESTKQLLKAKVDFLAGIIAKPATSKTLNKALVTYWIPV